MQRLFRHLFTLCKRTANTKKPAHIAQAFLCDLDGKIKSSLPINSTKRKDYKDALRMNISSNRLRIFKIQGSATKTTFFV